MFSSRSRYVSATLYALTLRFHCALAALGALHLRLSRSWRLSFAHDASSLDKANHRINKKNFQVYSLLRFPTVNMPPKRWANQNQILMSLCPIFQRFCNKRFLPPPSEVKQQIQPAEEQDCHELDDEVQNC